MARWLLVWLLLSIPALAQPIEVPIFEGAEGLTFFQQCAREYEALHPGTTVDLYGDPRIADKVRVRILEKSWPELTNANLNYGALLQDGDFYPLNAALDGPAYDSPEPWKDTFLPGTLDRYTKDGKIYGVPFMNTLWSVWYNQAMFEEKGWTPPTTWPQFLALCARIQASGIAPIAFQGRYNFYIQGLIDHTYYHCAGRQAYYQQKLLEPGSFDNPAMLETLGLVQQLVTSHYLQEGSMGMDHTQAQLEFFKGHAAMIFCGSWLKNEMKGNIPAGFRLGVFGYPLPASPRADPGALMLNSGYYFVMAHSRNPAGAVDFLRFMTSRRKAAEFSRVGEMMVAVKGANADLPPDMQQLARLVDSAQRTFGEAAGDQFPDMKQHWTDARQALLSGQETPAQVARELELQASLVRSRAQHPEMIRYRHFWKPLALLVFLLGTLLAALFQARPQAARVGDKRPAPWSVVLLFTGPALGLYTLFIALPSLTSFGWSLTSWDGLTPRHWVGLHNFQRLLFESDTFWKALGNNLFLMLAIPSCVIPLALFLASCLSRELKGAALFRVVFFFPNLLGVGGVLLWQQLYNPQGPINAALGLKSFTWLSPAHLYYALIPMSVWGACGFNMVLFLAAMESVPTDLYEAADLEGASAWRQFWSITIPLIWESLSVAVVFLLIGGMKAFESIWLLTNQQPVSKSHVIGTLMVSTMFTDFRLGEATALAVLLLTMVLAVSMWTNRVMRRDQVEM